MFPHPARVAGQAPAYDRREVGLPATGARLGCSASPPPLVAVKRRALLILVSLVGACLIGLLIYGVTAQSPDRTLDDLVARGRYPPAPEATRALPCEPACSDVLRCAVRTRPADIPLPFPRMALTANLRGSRGRRASTGGTCVAMLAAVTLLSSCGGTSGSASTQAQFIARANAICVAGLRSAARLNAPKSTSQLLTFSERTSSIVSKLASELRGVKAPSNARAAYTRFIKTVAQEARLLEDAVAALRARSAARARRALEGLSSNAANEQAKALGLTDCARTVSPG